MMLIYKIREKTILYSSQSYEICEIFIHIFQAVLCAACLTRVLCILYSCDLYFSLLVEELRKTLIAIWEGGKSAISPESLLQVIWKLVPRFR